MDYQEAQAKLHRIKQEHLLAYWQQLDPEERTGLLKQIASLDLSIYQQESQEHLSSFEPLTEVEFPSEEDRQIGLKLLSEGKAGCLLVAGGQGSRLRFDGPKGFFPITKIKNKSLFQVFAEKTLAASKQIGYPLPLAIMTSPTNHDDTLRFFEEHRFFGLDPDQISFFTQSSLPLLDGQGNFFLETPYKIAEGPDGNGGSLQRFVKSGIWQEWKDKGIAYLNYVLIDNPLADPFDARLIGHLARKNAQVAIKAIERLNPNEKVGVLGCKNGHVHVIEYSELSESDAKALASPGRLKYNCANISLFAFSMDFIEEAAHQIMPLHKAFKAVSYLGKDGKTTLSDKPNAWKFEKFIFDVLAYAKKTSVLIYPRDECFAPLKNTENISAVREAMQLRDRAMVEQLTGNPVSTHSFELAQEFYYPTDQMRKAWKGRIFGLTGYIEGNI